jgi:AcrR family transcriptional regulator
MRLETPGASIEAGRAVLRENPEASDPNIARAAGIGIATLYRRFGNRQIWVHYSPGHLRNRHRSRFERAESVEGPREGIRIAFEATLAVALRGAFPEGMTMGIVEAFLEPFQRLLARGRQQQGVIRADISPREEALRIALMLVVILLIFTPESEKWRRYLRLIMDSLEMTQAAPLPPAECVVNPFGA